MLLLANSVLQGWQTTGSVITRLLPPPECKIWLGNPILDPQKSIYQQ